MCFPLGVLGAIGLKDIESGTTLEIWWSGKAANDVVRLFFNFRTFWKKSKYHGPFLTFLIGFVFLIQIFNYRKKNEKKNRILEGNKIDGASVYKMKPFTIFKFPTGKRFEVQHAKYPQFHLTGFYYGKSTFKLHFPDEWTSVGLAGLFFRAVTGNFYKKTSRRRLLNMKIANVKNIFQKSVDKKSRFYENHGTIRKKNYQIFGKSVFVVTKKKF